MQSEAAALQTLETQGSWAKAQKSAKHLRSISLGFLYLDLSLGCANSDFTLEHIFIDFDRFYDSAAHWFHKMKK